jgi:hypothetical protein
MAIDTTGARRVLDLGTSRTSTTTLTAGPEIYKRMKVQPQIGEVLIAVVETSTAWTAPSGWTVNGETCHRLLVDPADLVAFWTFSFAESVEGRISFLLASPFDHAQQDGTWVAERSTDG